MSSKDNRKKPSRKADVRKDKKIEKKRAKISERAADSKAEDLAVQKKERRRAQNKSETRIERKRAAASYDKQEITPSNRKRLAWGLAVLLLMIVALIFRMGYWQIYKSDELKMMATDMQKVDTEIQPVRGSIYDSQMSTLAESVTEYELYAYTQTMYKAAEISSAEKQEVVNKLVRITGKDATEITKLMQGEENLVLIDDGLTREQVENAQKEFGTNVVV